MAERDFEFELERMFNQPPAFADNEAFAAGVERRLNKNWRMRALGIAAAGTVGGLIALTQTIRSGLGLEVAQASSRGVQQADVAVDGVLAQLMSSTSDMAANLGLSMNLMAMGAIALLLAGAAVSMRLFDEA